MPCAYTILCLPVWLNWNSYDVDWAFMPLCQLSCHYVSIMSAVSFHAIMDSHPHLLRKVFAPPQTAITSTYITDLLFLFSLPRLPIRGEKKKPS